MEASSWTILAWAALNSACRKSILACSAVIGTKGLGFFFVVFAKEKDLGVNEVAPANKTGSREKPSEAVVVTEEDTNDTGGNGADQVVVGASVETEEKIEVVEVETVADEEKTVAVEDRTVAVETLIVTVGLEALTVVDDDSGEDGEAAGTKVNVVLRPGSGGFGEKGRSEVAGGVLLEVEGSTGGLLWGVK
jgi:hypothetical protein